jgi:hypothetical protein
VKKIELLGMGDADALLIPSGIVKEAKAQPSAAAVAIRPVLAAIRGI